MNPCLALALCFPVGIVANDDLTPLLEPIREKHSLPSLGALTIVDGKIRDIGTTGLRCHGRTTKVTDDDKWHIGSCTKSMTATLAGTYIEEGKLNWDSTVGEVLGKKVKMRDEYKSVTLLQLLTHRSGIHGQVPPEIWKRTWKTNHVGDVRNGRREFVEAMLNITPSSKPETKYEYSNAGYVTAGLMLEVLTGDSWENLMRERLFKPLGMRSAGFGAAAKGGRVDQPWGHHDLTTPQKPGPGDDNPAALGPAGTVHLSLNDLARYVQMHLLDETGPVIKKKSTFRKLHTAIEDNSDYAGGWFVANRPWASGPALHHNGSNTMSYCVLWLAPKRRFAAIVVSNVGLNHATKPCDDAASALIERHLR